ncbi:MAG: glycosyltransferase family 2 protein [Candidatus Aenigmarchaeota archaeon]|nr:glycosyltransferase family 2 protein [Candidatus Aenigmarchaeota archaeon]
MDLSVIVPVYNEEGNIKELYIQIRDAVSSLGLSYEIIFVNDGSTDRTEELLRKVYSKVKDLKIINFRRNFGQSAAMLAGFRIAKGKYIVSIDGDLQNDPKDIPALLAKLESGYDVVSGWRFRRKDTFFKRFFSRFASLLRRKFLGMKIHDYGCSLKAYKREALSGIELYGEMHRYIPPLLQWKGFRIGEVKVSHRNRQAGRTKYGVSRLYKGFIDMGVVWFWQKYSSRPMHMFSFIGILAGGFGVFCTFYSMYLKMIRDVSLSDTFLPTMAVFSIMIGAQMFVTGILADIIIKNYYKDSEPYSIKDILE